MDGWRLDRAWSWLMRQRRGTAFVGACVAMAGAGMAVVADTPWALGPAPTGYAIRWTSSVRPIEDADAEAGALGWSMEGRRYPASFLMGYFDGQRTVGVGYTLSYAGGPPGIRSWVGREAVDIELWNLGDLGAHERVRADVERLRRDLAPGVLSAPVLAGRTVRIDQLYPERWWLNGRGILGWFGRLGLGAGAAIGAVSWAATAAWGQRKRRIAAGVCPTCEYPLRTLGVERCPECGLALTVYEQSILDAQVDPWSLHAGGHGPAAD